MSRIKIAGVQMGVQMAEPEKNLAAMRQRLSVTSKEGAILTVFPECAISGYCFESLEEAQAHAQPMYGPHLQSAQAMCAEFHSFIAYGFLEQDGEQVFNSVSLVGPSGLIGHYRKIHLPFLGVDRFTSPGDRLDVFELPALDENGHSAFGGGLRIGMQICYDCSFPEASRVLMLKGADLIILPTNWPPTSGLASEFIPNARALENHLYFMSVNRVGTERGFSFIGKSKFCDPSGRSVDFANHDQEATIYGEVDPQRSRQKHLVNIPGVHEVDRVKDRRPKVYGDLVKG